MDNTKISIDTTNDKEYKGNASDFFLCHSPLIKDSEGKEVEYVLQNEWPFVMLQVLKFEDEEKAHTFGTTAPGNNAPCLIVGRVVLRMSGALANVVDESVKMTPQQVGTHINKIIPKAAHWYRCVCMDSKKIR